MCAKSSYRIDTCERRKKKWQCCLLSLVFWGVVSCTELPGKQMVAAEKGVSDSSGRTSLPTIARIFSLEEGQA